MDKTNITLEEFYNLVIEEEKLEFSFTELDNGEVGISFFSSDPEFLSIMLEQTNLQMVAEKVLILGTAAGLKEPTEFYKTIERFVKDEKLDQDKIIPEV